MKARGGRRKKRPARAGGRGARRAAKVQRRKRRKQAAAPPPDPEPHSAHQRRKAEEAREFPAALGLLQVAVPLWVEQFRPMAWEERMRVRDGCLGALCTGEGPGLEGVANLACGAKGKPGQVAGAFNALAKALALGALQPGGVTFAGMHFEASTPEAPRT